MSARARIAAPKLGKTPTPILSMHARPPTLREGAGRLKGRDVLHFNITAAQIVAEVLKSSIGPRGMDKLMVSSTDDDVIITSDGRTILEKINIEHPAAKIMVEVAQTTDDEVGDGTTSAVVIAGELLRKAEKLFEKNIHPTIIINGYRKAAEKALETLEKIAISVGPTEKSWIKKVATTAMASKLVVEHKEQLADITAEAILDVAEKSAEGYKADVDYVVLQKKRGASLSHTTLIEGMIIDKEVVYPGMPKRVEDAKIALLDCLLDAENSKLNSKFNIESPDQMEAFLKQEENILKNMVEKVTETGANVVIAQKDMDEIAQHFFVRKGVLAVKRVKRSEMKKIVKATGGNIVTNLDEITEKDLGYAKLVEERQIGGDRMTFVEGCKNPKAVTILIRGGTQRVIDEAERSIHDALCVVRDVVQEPKIVAGGGAPEMEISGKLRDYADDLPNKEQLAVQTYAEALEIIVALLGESAGLDPIDVVLELRTRHKKGETWAGVGINEGMIKNMKELEVFEPLSVKKQIIKSATEAASMILKIDDLITVSRFQLPVTKPKGGYRDYRPKPPE